MGHYTNPIETEGGGVALSPAAESHWDPGCGFALGGAGVAIADVGSAALVLTHVCAASWQMRSGSGQ